jgi:hypothetical protein
MGGSDADRFGSMTCNSVLPAVLALPAEAQTWPTRPVTMVSLRRRRPMDVVRRNGAEPRRQLGQQVIVENRWRAATA